MTTLAGLAGSQGSADGTGSAARFNTPSGVAVDSAGNVYVADTFSHTIRQVTPAGAVTTLAGSAGNAGSADGAGGAAQFACPRGVAVDSAGNVYVADTGNSTIRQVTPAGVVTTLAGAAGISGSADGTNSTARFNSPYGVAVDSAGNVYVADEANDTIRQVTPAGVVTTLGGSPGNWGSADGVGAAAQFNWPHAIAVDSAGDLYVADTVNSRISKGTLRQSCPPQFQTVIRSARAILLTWTTLPGRNYQLQYETNLARPNWQNLGGPMAATNNTASASDALGPDLQRFYRVVLLP